MFDSKAEINLKVHTAHGGSKRLLVRYPTDDEWITWRRKKKIVQRALGRGFDVEPATPEPADLDLLNAIKLDETQVSRTDAFRIVNRLARFEVIVAPTLIGAAYKIEAKIMDQLLTAHVLRVPSVQELAEYHRNYMSVVFGQYGLQTITIDFTAGEALYNRLVQRTEGYVHTVPVPHKAEVINVLAQLIRRESGGSIC